MTNFPGAIRQSQFILYLSRIEIRIAVVTPTESLFTLIVTRQCSDHSFHAATMTTTTSLESTHIAIQAKVKFAGISQLSTDSVHLLEAYVGGGWQLKMYIPKAVPDDRKSSLVLFLNPILRSKIGAVDAIKISFSLESLRGEVHTTKTFKWELQGDKELAARNMVNWNKFWHENAAHRVDDGFFVRVSITSVSSRPTAFDPSILNTISQLTQGKNVFDTKFFSFSRPRYEYQGAQDPLPVYANSTFLRSQSDYFQTSMSSPLLTSQCCSLCTCSVLWRELYGIETRASWYTTQYSLDRGVRL